MTTTAPAPRFRCTSRDCVGIVIEGHNERIGHDLVQHGGRELTRPMAAAHAPMTTTTATAADTTEEYNCTCGVPDSEHCQTCWCCPGSHEDMCGF